MKLKNGHHAESPRQRASARTARGTVRVIRRRVRIEDIQEVVVVSCWADQSIHTQGR